MEEVLSTGLAADQTSQNLAFRLTTTAGDFQFEGEYFLLEESKRIKNEIDRQKNPRLASRRSGKDLSVSSISEFYIAKGDIHGDVREEEDVKPQKRQKLQLTPKPHKPEKKNK
jgi:hypothetical protein